MLLVCQNVLCQEYFFDTFLEYKYSTKKNSSEGTLLFMINSKNNGYVFFWNTRDKISQGSVIDFNSRNSYCYKTKDSIKFDYLCTNNSIMTLFSEKKSNSGFDYITEEAENNKSKILITKFKVTKSGKKKTLNTIKIEIEKNDFVFNYNLLKFFFHQYFNDEDLTFLGNKVPYHISFEHKNGFKRSFELKKIEKIDKLLSTNKITTN